MKTTIRKIGNSKGLLIPASLIAACAIQDEVIMHVENNRIIIEAVNPEPRKNWFNGYDAQKDESAWSELVETQAEQVDWEW
ncbi:MAG TPA: AbrB/MazE/SpoVT family DNA-binding domain-containing protein [Methylophilaceae bacterium]|nr:AbrB/MazE/SpoVT family DNA-binding domain-containing protein [Methylophilaceae bacterium]